MADLPNRASPELVVAGGREAGAVCLHCTREIRPGERVARCPRCGGVHHAPCWQAEEGCGAYECAPARRTLSPSQQPSMRITADDLSRAVPLPSGRAPPAVLPPIPLRPAKSGTSGLAVAALVVAIAGIPLFGLITGLVAIILGSLALGHIRQSRQTGTVLALAGVLLGVADMAGWLIFLSVVLSRPGPSLELVDFEPDTAALDSLDPRIGRAMKANVLIETRQRRRMFGARGIGAGVILCIRDGSALVLTNRHVIDPRFAAGGAGRDEKAAPARQISVKLIGRPAQPGRVVWVAPDAVDLALLSVPAVGATAQSAAWRENPQLSAGQEVFSIGNPLNLGWSHSRGAISQLRLHRSGSRTIRIIQTDTAINPGNSGGGLFDEDGMLIGINTWTNDKGMSEGLSFAIALTSFFSLEPPLPEAFSASAQTDPP